MKSAFRSSIAAAALAVVPFAALLAAQPAAAEHRVTVAAADDWQQHRYPRYPRDHRPPLITDVSPEHGDRVDDRRRTRIAARVVDQGSGIRTVFLRVDGRDVTAYTRFDGEQIRYREDLAPGRHHAEVIVRDRAGNTSRRAWSFFVVDRDYGYGGHGPGRYDDPRRW